MNKFRVNLPVYPFFTEDYSLLSWSDQNKIRYLYLRGRSSFYQISASIAEARNRREVLEKMKDSNFLDILKVSKTTLYNTTCLVTILIPSHSSLNPSHPNSNSPRFKIFHLEAIWSWCETSRKLDLRKSSEENYLHRRRIFRNAKLDASQGSFRTEILWSYRAKL